MDASQRCFGPSNRHSHTVSNGVHPAWRTWGIHVHSIRLSTASGAAYSNARGRSRSRHASQRLRAAACGVRRPTTGMASGASVATTASGDASGLLVEGARSATPIGDVVLAPVVVEPGSVRLEPLMDMNDTTPMRAASPSATRNRNDRDPSAASVMVSRNCTSHRTSRGWPWWACTELGPKQARQPLKEPERCDRTRSSPPRPVPMVEPCATPSYTSRPGPGATDA